MDYLIIEIGTTGWKITKLDPYVTCYNKIRIRNGSGFKDEKWNDKRIWINHGRNLGCSWSTKGLAEYDTKKQTQQKFTT